MFCDGTSSHTGQRPYSNRSRGQENVRGLLGSGGARGDNLKRRVVASIIVHGSKAGRIVALVVVAELRHDRRDVATERGWNRKHRTRARGTGEEVRGWQKDFLVYALQVQPRSAPKRKHSQGARGSNPPQPRRPAQHNSTTASILPREREQRKKKKVWGGDTGLAAAADAPQATFDKTRRVPCFLTSCCTSLGCFERAQSDALGAKMTTLSPPHQALTQL